MTRSRRDPLLADDEFHVRIGHQRDVDAVADGKGGMFVIVHFDAALRQQTREHRAQHHASRRVMRRDDVFHDRHRDIGECVPAAGMLDFHRRPTGEEHEDDRLRFDVDLVIVLPAIVHVPSALIGRQYTLGQPLAIDITEWTGRCVNQHVRVPNSWGELTKFPISCLYRMRSQIRLDRADLSGIINHVRTMQTLGGVRAAAMTNRLLGASAAISLGSLVLLHSACAAAAAPSPYRPIMPSMADRTIVLTGRDLTIDEVVQVARYGAKVALSPEARQRSADGYGLLLEAAAEGVSVYWFNRGSGSGRESFIFTGDPLSPANKKLLGGAATRDLPGAARSPGSAPKIGEKRSFAPCWWCAPTP